MPQYNTFDGVGNGVALTTGNTGGLSGIPFDVINALANGTLAGDTTRSAHGAASLKVATGITAGTISAQWNPFPVGQSLVYFRMYLFITASASPAWRPFAARTGASHVASILVSGTQLSISYGAGFTGTTAFTTAMPTGQWVRVEGHFIGDPTAGEVAMSLFLTADGIVPAETHTFSGLNTVGLMTVFQAGQLNSAASSGPFWLDELALSATGPVGPAFGPPSVVIYPPASPAFIKSAMPRMHIQNLITGAWINRDVQGVVSPSITWALNTADSFTCQLAPPRGELMDAQGNALVMEWRDAIYLEEDNLIKFGGIVTQSAMTGPSWNITAMGFAGYPNGMPYEGANYSATKIDALDVIRFLWNYLQTQPGGNIGMELGTQKSGTLLGAQTDTGVYSEISKKANTGDTSIWIGNAQAFNDREQITISGIPYTISHVPRVNGIATGQMTLTTKLTEPHAIHDPVAQVTPLNSPLAKAAAAGANNIQVGTTAPFASGENIMIGTDLYTINVIVLDSKGFITGNMTLTSNLKRAYAKGTMVSQVRTINPFQLFWYNSTDIGGEITSIQQEAIFDFRERHFWSDQATRNAVRHQLVFGVPRLGTRLTGLRFAEGENIVQAVQVTRDGTKYASNVIGLGAGSGAAQIRVTASSANTGRLRRTAIFTDQTANTVARMSAKATKVLTSMSNIDTVTQIMVKNHPNAPFGSFSPGDDIPVMIASGWRNTTIWSRIVSMTQDPTTDLMSLSLARSDSFTYIAESGQAGTL